MLDNSTRLGATSHNQIHGVSITNEMSPHQIDNDSDSLGKWSDVCSNFCGKNVLAVSKAIPNLIFSHMNPNFNVSSFSTLPRQTWPKKKRVLTIRCDIKTLF